MRNKSNTSIYFIFSLLAQNLERWTRHFMLFWILGIFQMNSILNTKNSHQKSETYVFLIIPGPNISDDGELRTYECER